MLEGVFYIHDADDFANSFEDVKQLRDWLEEAHKEYIFTDLTELKQLFYDNEMFDLFAEVKAFETRYILEDDL